MKTYHDQLRHILAHGLESTDRTGTGTKRVFGMQARYNLADGFPLVTTKKMFWKGIVGELIWFLEGSTNRDRLEEITFGTIGERSTIWDEWSDENGDLGPVYGAQWRSWPIYSEIYGRIGEIDQIRKLIDQIRENPDSRRLIVSAWNPAQISQMALPPCHTLWQISVLNGTMHLHLYQRSADMFLGVPFNIASYSLLLMLIAQVTGYQPGEFIHSIGDAHVYLNHVDAVTEQLCRTPRDLPRVALNTSIRSIFDFTMRDIGLIGYNPWPAIKGQVAV